MSQLVPTLHWMEEGVFNPTPHLASWGLVLSLFPLGSTTIFHTHICLNIFLYKYIYKEFIISKKNLTYFGSILK